MVVQWLGLQASNAGEGGFDPMCCMVEPKTKTKIFFKKIALIYTLRFLNAKNGHPFKFSGCYQNISDIAISQPVSKYLFIDSARDCHE